MKNFMVTGANFRNKGAQAMLFVTIYELRKRYPDCMIYFATGEEIPMEEYRFNRVRYTHRLKKIALGGILGIKELLVSIAVDFIKRIIRYPGSKGGYVELIKILHQIDLIIDISGFSLGDKWNYQGQEEYLDNIRLAKKYNIKMVLMPQSFGPFNYNKSMQKLHLEIRELLQYPYLIYAREREGENLLRKKYGLTNIQSSPDIVLQNQKIDSKVIFKREPVVCTPEDICDNSVVIVPNVKCIQHGNEKQILFLYRKIIEVLLKNSKEIYLLRHSKEDLFVCKCIKEMFLDNMSVHLLEDDFSCIEFDEVIKKFQFCVVSRFHGAVHSYKNCVPCIILGWAIKYKELSVYMNQEEFAFDITNDKLNIDEILQHVCKMIISYREEKIKIEKCLRNIQQSSCFNILEEIFDE